MSRTYSDESISIGALLPRAACGNWIFAPTVWNSKMIYQFNPNIDVIDCFTEEFSFLSMSADLDLHYRDGFLAKSIEHIYHAEKALNYWGRKYIISSDTSGEAMLRADKSITKSLSVQEKIKTMIEIVRYVFTNDLEYRRHLIQTEDAILIAGNREHDHFWGVCQCDDCRSLGLNIYGQILMYIRSELYEDGEC